MRGYAKAYEGDSINLSVPGSKTRRGRVGHNVAQTLDTQCNQGVMVVIDKDKICMPVLTPDRTKKRQNGRRFKDNGEPSFTLTSQDKHGVAIGIDDMYSNRPVRYYEEEVSTLRADRQGLKVGQLLEIAEGEENKEYPGVYVKLDEDCVVYAVWYEKYDCYIAIRKLTPKECFRLQGWSDDYFERAEFVNSNSQLYKQAGNGISVPVVYEIGKRLKEYE